MVYNTAPENLEVLSSLAVEENKPSGSVVGQFTAMDRNGNSLSYHLVDGLGSDDNHLFVLEESGLLRSNLIFDYEEDTSPFSIRVQVRDEYDGFLEGNFSVQLEDVYEDLDGDQIEDHLDEDIDGDGYTNEEEIAYPSDPRDPSSVANATPQYLDFQSELDVLENKKPGMPVGKLVSTEADDDRFELVEGQGDDHNQLFSLDEFGILRAIESFDYELGETQFLIRVGVTTSSGDSTHQVFTVHLLDDPYESSPYSSDQGVAAAVAGESSSTDYDQTGVIDPGAGWEDSADGGIEQYTGYLGSSDAETTRDDGLRVYAALTMVENEPVGSVVGEFQAYDEDDWAVLTYSLVDGDGALHNELFNMGPQGELSTTTVFDYETQEREYSVRIRATDERNTYTEKSFVIYLLDVFEDLDGDQVEDHLDIDIDGDGYTNEEEVSYGSDPRDAGSLANRAPTDLNSSNLLSVAENQTVGSYVGEFLAIDTDGDVLTYHLIDGVTDNALFILEENGTLYSATEFDYEKDRIHYQIQVIGRDSKGAEVLGEFEVFIVDLDDEIPVITLNGDAVVAHEAGLQYLDLGAHWTDNVDGEGSAMITGEVDVMNPGMYEVVYDYEDSSGNPALRVTRMVEVVDTTAPVITLNGAAEVFVEAGSSYSESERTGRILWMEKDRR